MKYPLLTCIILAFTILGCADDSIYPEAVYNCNSLNVPDASLHPKNERYEALLHDILNAGAPGVQLSVYEPGTIFWNGSAGYADLASDVAMRTCNITRVGSTVKTLTAVSILLLSEYGKIDLDAPISTYLSEQDLAGLANAEKSSVRQLLDHSSGIYNYIQSSQFQTASLNNLTKVWQPEELLDYARGEEPNFAPGTDVVYSNTGYILLGKLIERVTGKPFYTFFQNHLFDPLGMSNTSFAATDPVPESIVQGYVDFYSNLNVINATNYSGWDYFTADGGLISNAHDLNIFMQAVFSGKVISAASLQEMLKWQQPKNQDSEGFSTEYGLGIFKIHTSFGEAYIHSGDAIGYFASIVYFPEQEVAITWTVNGNYGKIDAAAQSKEAMERIFETVLE